MAALGVLLRLLAVTAVCSGSLVVVNSGVEVARGRSVFVTETELKISVEPGADCKVEVVMNEAVTQRVGRLTPQVRTMSVVNAGTEPAHVQCSEGFICCLQVFDCSFLEDEVKYVHNGSPLLDKDTVMLRVYRLVSVWLEGHRCFQT